MKKMGLTSTKVKKRDGTCLWALVCIGLDDALLEQLNGLVHWEDTGELEEDRLHHLHHGSCEGHVRAM